MKYVICLILGSCKQKYFDYVATEEGKLTSPSW